MDFDFQYILLIATLVTGVLWLLDLLILAPRRRRRDRKRSGLVSRRKSKRHPLIEYAVSFFPILLVIFLARSFLYEPFKIPSNSMMPTLLTGDFILVNKFDYGLRMPITNEVFLNIGKPQRGDVVVFRFPQDPKVYFIKRLIGLPGDKIDYVDKHIIVNGERIEQKAEGRYTGIGSGREMTGAQQAQELLPDATHDILLRDESPNLPYGCNLLANGPVTIPEGKYLMMGDNRDNSNDGRCWGLVDDKLIVGKAVSIWLHWDGNLQKFPPIEWARIFTGIH